VNFSASPSPAEEQAALWAAKLDGSTLGSADRTALEAWLAQSPQHRALLTQYCQFSADLEQQLPVLVLAGAVKLPSDPPAARSGMGRILWIAGTMAAAAAVAIGFWASRPTQQIETIATSVAQRRTLQLADGSRVELNARTSLRVDLSAAERHVRMADGEAFFTVAKDASRPFIVETPAGSVRVTGTVFDVHADVANLLAVTVVEGSVQVRPAGTAGNTPAPVALRANDQLTSEAGQVDVRPLNESQLDDALAWRRGEIVFDGTPLSKALAQFARYHGLSITAAPAVANLRVGGRYGLDNVDAFLSAIEAVLPVQVSRESSGAIAVTPRAGR
jgi:transmembrane sensor